MIHEEHGSLRDAWTAAKLASGGAAVLGVEALGGDGWVLVAIWAVLAAVDFRSHRRALRREAP